MWPRLSLFRELWAKKSNTASNYGISRSAGTTWEPAELLCIADSTNLLQGPFPVQARKTISSQWGWQCARGGQWQGDLPPERDLGLFLWITVCQRLSLTHYREKRRLATEGLQSPSWRVPNSRNTTWIKQLSHCTSICFNKCFYICNENVSIIFIPRLTNKGVHVSQYHCFVEEACGRTTLLQNRFILARFPRLRRKIWSFKLPTHVGYFQTRPSHLTAFATAVVNGLQLRFFVASVF